MTTNSPLLSLVGVLGIVNEKLHEAKDYLQEMEKVKSNPKVFRSRLSAFLAAAHSVTDFVKKHGTRYAKQIGKETQFSEWYKSKEDLFRVPNRFNSKKVKNTGTDTIWVYLTAARHETIHVQQINLYEQHEFEVKGRLIVHENHSYSFEIEQDNGTIEIVEPMKGQQPVLKAVDTGKRAWVFMSLTVTDQHGNYVATLQPPTTDVITVCKDHIEKLEHFIEECKTVLEY